MPCKAHPSCPGLPRTGPLHGLFSQRAAPIHLCSLAPTLHPAQYVALRGPREVCHCPSNGILALPTGSLDERITNPALPTGWVAVLIECDKGCAGAWRAVRLGIKGRVANAPRQ